MLWRKVLQESVMNIQCGLQLGTQQQQQPVVILVSKSNVTAVNGSTGEENVNTSRVSVARELRKSERSQ